MRSLNSDVRMAQTYFNLSELAKDRRNNNAADEWLRKSLQIYSRKGNADGVIALGRIAERACHFEYAERLYREALQIAKNGNDSAEATCYAYLGFLASQQGDYEAAIRWYEQSFATNEKRGAMDFAAKDCISLGNLSLKSGLESRPDLDSAAKWFRKALCIDPNSRWWDWLILYARLWRYKYLNIFWK